MGFKKASKKILPVIQIIKGVNKMIMKCDPDMADASSVDNKDSDNKDNKDNKDKD